MPAVVRLRFLIQAAGDERPLEGGAMATKIEILVEPKAETQVGWFAHLFSWNREKKDVIRHVLELKSYGEGKFTLESKADLPGGTYGLLLHVFEPGNECSATVTGKPQIDYPFGKSWPLKVKVPAHFSQENGTYYFEHGGQS